MKEHGYQYIPWGHKVNIIYPIWRNMDINIHRGDTSWILYFLNEGTWISIYTVGTQGEYYISYMKEQGYQYIPWGHKVNIIYPLWRNKDINIYHGDTRWILYILYEGTWISIYTVGTQGEYYISYKKEHGYQYIPWEHKVSYMKKQGYQYIPWEHKVNIIYPKWRNKDINIYRGDTRWIFYILYEGT